MKMKRIVIQLPSELKTELDRLRRNGTSISGFIRNLVEQEFASRRGKKH